MTVYRKVKVIDRLPDEPGSYYAIRSDGSKAVCRYNCEGEYWNELIDIWLEEIPESIL